MESLKFLKSVMSVPFFSACGNASSITFLNMRNVMEDALLKVIFVVDVEWSSYFLVL
jgi:hypothetical protein